MCASGLSVAQGAIVDDVLRAASRPDGRVFVLFGPPGSGRSHILDAIAARFAAVPDHIVIRADLARYPGSATERPAGSTVCRIDMENLLADLMDQVPSPPWWSPKHLTWRDRDQARLGSEDDALARDFVAGLARRTHCRPVLVLDNVAGNVCGLRRLLHHLNRTARSITALAWLASSVDPPAWPPWLEPDRVCPAPPLDMEEVAALLPGRLAGGNCTPAAALNWTGGHPLAVTVLADLQPQEVTAILSGDEPDALPRTVVDRLSPVLTFRTETDGNAPRYDRRMLLMIELAATAPRFDAPLVNSVLRALGEPPTATADALACLPFAMPVAGQPGTYTLPGFVRSLIQRELRTRVSLGPPQRSDYHRLCLHVIAHLKQNLRDRIERRDGIFSWEKLEDQANQELVLDFVRSLARHDSSPAWRRLEFAHIYFDALWWWGWYLRSPLTRTLVEAWKAGKHEPQPDALIEALHRYDRSYVPFSERWRMPVGPALASRCAEALDALDAADAALAPVDLTDSRNRRLRAIIQDFRGDAWRGCTPPGWKEAAECYRDSLRLFALNPPDEDGWNLPWVYFDLADLAVEAGRRCAAEGYARHALGLAAQASDEIDRDYEIAGMCHRLIADIRFDDDPVGAFRHYARGVFCAYVAHGVPASAAQPATYPDSYTQAFHEEQISRVTAKLALLDGPCLAAVRSELARWRRGSNPDLVEAAEGAQGHREPDATAEAALLPRPPVDAELERDCAYVRGVWAARLQVGRDLMDLPPGVARLARRGRARPASGRDRPPGSVAFPEPYSPGSPPRPGDAAPGHQTGEAAPGYRPAPRC